MSTLASFYDAHLTIAGHRTSLSLEPEFWETLQRAAKAQGKPVRILT